MQSLRLWKRVKKIRLNLDIDEAAAIKGKKKYACASWMGTCQSESKANREREGGKEISSERY
jgi:hypothetical protein